MKAKLSATVEAPLIDFLDSLPGETRSEKLEQCLRQIQKFVEEQELRRQLMEHSADADDEERLERGIWERTMSEAMWKK